MRITIEADPGQAGMQMAYEIKRRVEEMTPIDEFVISQRTGLRAEDESRHRLYDTIGR